jgi:hypothetical protein
MVFFFRESLHDKPINPLSPWQARRMKENVFLFHARFCTHSGKKQDRERYRQDISAHSSELR